MYSALRILEQPATEPVTLEQVRKHCRIDTEEFDDLLQIYLQTARTLAEQFLSRALITQQLQWIMAEVPPSGALPLLPMPLLVLPVILSFPQVWNRPIDLPRCPVQSVDAVEVSYQDGTTSTLDPATDYSVDIDLDPARLRLSRLTLPVYARTLSVSFHAGYGDVGDAIPRPIIAAILLITAWLWENRGDVAGDMPGAAQALLWPYKVMSFGG